MIHNMKISKSFYRHTVIEYTPDFMHITQQEAYQ